MHKAVYRAYSRIVPELTGSVLEVGAVPSKDSLLCLPQLKNAERVGLNIDGPHEYDGFRIVAGNANSMPFEDDCFDLVLCNAMIEHDPFFWKTIAEIKRVARPGGLIIVGAPGYKKMFTDRYRRNLGYILFPLNNNSFLNALFTATITFQVHNDPGDFYRFSEQAFRQVIMDGLTDVTVKSIMLPPRVIGVGSKPRSN
jgi:SAM-dependent methyltransferase